MLYEKFFAVGKACRARGFCCATFNKMIERGVSPKTPCNKGPCSCVTPQVVALWCCQVIHGQNDLIGWADCHPRTSSSDAREIGGRQMSSFDFKALNRAALPHLRTILERWLPGGRVMGQDYVALNPRRVDRNLGSFRISLASYLNSKIAEKSCTRHSSDDLTEISNWSS